MRCWSGCPHTLGHVMYHHIKRFLRAVWHLFIGGDLCENSPLCKNKCFVGLRALCIVISLVWDWLSHREWSLCFSSSPPPQPPQRCLPFTLSLQGDRHVHSCLYMPALWWHYFNVCLTSDNSPTVILYLCVHADTRPSRDGADHKSSTHHSGSH